MKTILFFALLLSPLSSFADVDVANVDCGAQVTIEAYDALTENLEDADWLELELLCRRQAAEYERQAADLGRGQRGYHALLAKASVARQTAIALRGRL